MRISEIKYEDLTMEAVDKILFEGIEDNQLCGDCIMVLGSASAYKYRVPKTIEVYNEKRSDKILVSGGTVWDTEYGNISEAESMKKNLMKSGIPSDSIFIENLSSSTVENFICSLYVLHKNFKITNIKELLLITTRYHMRRSLMMAKTFMPKWITVYPCPADDMNTLRHNWHLQEKSKKRAMDEAYRISCYVRDGFIDDFEI